MSSYKKKLHNESLSTNNKPLFSTILEKYSFLIFLVSSILISFLIFKEFFFGEFLYFFKDIGSDTINITLPNYMQGKHLSETEGFLKFWSFHSGMGQPVGNTITLNPLFYIKKFLISVFGYNIWFYRIYLIYFFYILPAGIIAFFYFRTLNLSKFTAIIGGLILQFSGYMIIGSQWGHAVRIFNFVFLIFSFEQILMKKRWWFLPIAVYLLSNNLFILAVNTLFLGIYSFARYLAENNGKLKGYFLLVLKMFGIALLGLLINAPRAWANFLRMYLTPRVVGDVNQMDSLLNQPEQLDDYLRIVTTIIRFFGNDIFGAGSEFSGWYNYLEAPIFYIGLISLLLLPVSIFFLKKKRRIIYSVFLIFWLLVAFVPILRHSVNLFMGNYFKNTIDLFVPFTVLFIAALGLDKIIKGKKINPLLLVITTGILLVLLHFPYFEFTNSVLDFNKKIIASLFLIVYAILIYFISKNKHSNILKIILLLFVITELTVISFSSVNDRDVYMENELIGDIAGYDDATIPAISYIEKTDSAKFYRIEKDYSSGNSVHGSLNDAKVQGYYGTASYSSFNQYYYIKFLQESEVISKNNESETRWSPGVRGIPLMMTFASVKYYLTKDFDNPIKYNGYDSIYTSDDVLVLKNKHFLPLGFSYDKYILEKDFKELSPFKKQQALLRAIVIENIDNSYNLEQLDTNLLLKMKNFNLDTYISMVDSLKQSTFKINKFKHKKIQGQISLDNDKMLFFSIPYDKGWKIYANGKKLKVNRANIGFISVYLTKGNYKLILKYKPPYFKCSIIVAIVSFLILIFVFYKIFREKS